MRTAPSVTVKSKYVMLIIMKGHSAAMGDAGAGEGSMAAAAVGSPLW